MKNLGRRILDIEHMARHELDDLLSLHYDRSQLTEELFWSWPKEYWKIRKWRRGSRKALSTLWLLIASIEAMRAQWNDRKHYFDSDPDDTRPVFENDASNDDRAIQGIDVASYQRALEHASARLDATGLTRATLLGGAAGAIVALLIHFLEPPAHRVSHPRFRTAVKRLRCPMFYNPTAKVPDACKKLSRPQTRLFAIFPRCYRPGNGARRARPATPQAA